MQNEWSFSALANGLNHGYSTCGPTAVTRLQFPWDIARLIATSMTPKVWGMMGLMVLQQLEGHRLSTQVLDTSGTKYVDKDIFFWGSLI